MTRGELISQVKNQLRLVNADVTLSNRFIWSLIEKHLMWLIKRENSKLDLFGLNDIFQTYKCVDVIDAPAIDECCGLRSKCTVHRTAEKLPQIYEDGDGVMIKSVYSIDGSVDFTNISIHEYMRKLENPTTRKYDKGRYYFYSGGYLYFPKQNIKKVMVKAYFTEEVNNNCCKTCEDNDGNCISKFDQKIRIPDYIVGELMAQVINDLTITIKIPQDQMINKNENLK
jgi:hypothetical protein